MYLSNKFFETIRLFDKARSFYLTAQLNDSMGLRSSYSQQDEVQSQSKLEESLCFHKKE